MFPLPFGFSTSFSQPLDPDAAAFLSAAGISNQVQSNAINNLVIDLKADNLWTEFDVIYPFVGGTAATHKLNLKNPANTDAAFRINYFGSWTHTAKGMRITSMGAGNRAETLYSPFDNLSSISNSQVVYYTELVSPLTSGTIGCIDEDATPDSYFFNGVTSGASRNQEITGIGSFVNGALIITTRDTNTRLKYKAAYDTNAFADIGTDTNTGGALPDIDYFLGATLIRQGGSFTANYSDGGTYGFVALGNGLGTSASNNMATIVQDYQTALGRAYINT
jgi:hypothetical protein